MILLIDIINFGISIIGLINKLTAEVVAKNNTDNNGRMITKHASATGVRVYGWFLGRDLENDNLEWKTSTTGSNWTGGYTVVNSYKTNTHYYFTEVYNGSNALAYVDGLTDTRGDLPVFLTGNVYGRTQRFLSGNDGRLVTSTFHNGIIDKIQVSLIDRSAAWIKATNANFRVTLLIYGNEGIYP
ncbi:MAG: hypothetical protein GX947_09335 [Tissierellia bacterium]|nr:hypothetical protein [Tissierellia bacterium]